MTYGPDKRTHKTSLTMSGSPTSWKLSFLNQSNHQSIPLWHVFYLNSPGEASDCTDESRKDETYVYSCIDK